MNNCHACGFNPVANKQYIRAMKLEVNALQQNSKLQASACNEELAKLKEALNNYHNLYATQQTQLEFQQMQLTNEEREHAMTKSSLHYEFVCRQKNRGSFKSSTCSIQRSDESFNGQKYCQTLARKTRTVEADINSSSGSIQRQF